MTLDTDMLTISRMRDGGYTVTLFDDRRNMINVTLYASTTIDEALAYVRRTLEMGGPKEPT